MIKKEAPEGHACVFLRDMEVNIRIGLKPEERTRPQRVLVNVELYTDAVSYLSAPSEQSIIDYDRIRRAVNEWPERPHVDLLETYARELLDLAFGFESVTAARISISKPDIYPDVEAAGVEAFLTRENLKR